MKIRRSRQPARRCGGFHIFLMGGPGKPSSGHGLPTLPDLSGNPHVEKLLLAIRSCVICKAHLPFPPRPIIQAGASARILVIGQAPGMKVQLSGIPWDDASGRELRRWMGVTEDIFYDDTRLALLPMGFCYPGKGPSGDLPPRPECAPKWHQELRSQLTGVRLTILIGQYAQKYHLGDQFKGSITETVRSFREYLPDFLPLVHPSPRNRIWQARNPWFENDVLPVLQSSVANALATGKGPYQH